MTYSADGRQYIIVAVSGGNYSGEYIAFALPAAARSTSRSDNGSRYFLGKGLMMTRTVKRIALAAASVVGVVGAIAVAPHMTAQLSGQAPGFPSTKNGEWPYYTADVRGSRYSPLDQIPARTSISSRWRGGSRPTISARGPSSSSKARR